MITRDVFETAEDYVAGWSMTDHASLVPLVAAAIWEERKRCLGHVYGQAGSDNAAERVAEKIRGGE